MQNTRSEFESLGLRPNVGLQKLRVLNQYCFVSHAQDVASCFGSWLPVNAKGLSCRKACLGLEMFFLRRAFQFPHFMLSLLWKFGLVAWGFETLVLVKTTFEPPLSTRLPAINSITQISPSPIYRLRFCSPLPL